MDCLMGPSAASVTSAVQWGRLSLYPCGCATETAAFSSPSPPTPGLAWVGNGSQNFYAVSTTPPHEGLSDITFFIKGFICFLWTNELAIQA